MTNTDKNTLKIFYLSLGMLLYCLATLGLLIYALYLIIFEANNWSVTLLVCVMVLSLPYVIISAKAEMDNLKTGNDEPDQK